MKGYKTYLNVFADKVDFYFNFDEDFSPAGFEKNFAYQLELEGAGFEPVPVVHDCYSDEIETYIEKGHKLVSIGSGELKWATQYELYRIVASLYKKGVKVHFLGCTAYEKLAYTGIKSMESRPDDDYKDLFYVRRRFISIDGLRQAMGREVNASLAARLPDLWRDNDCLPSVSM